MTATNGESKKVLRLFAGLLCAGLGLAGSGMLAGCGGGGAVFGAAVGAAVGASIGDALDDDCGYYDDCYHYKSGPAEYANDW